MWWIPLIAVLLAAESEASAPEPSAGPPAPPGPPRLPGPHLGMATREELEREAEQLLGEGGWPENLDKVDEAFMAFVGDAMGEEVHPWTAAQMRAFRDRDLICPLGHNGPFRYLQIGMLEDELEAMAPYPNMGRVKVTQAYERPDAEAHGLVRCQHPGHTAENRVFWFPFRHFEIDWE